MENVLSWINLFNSFDNTLDNFANALGSNCTVPNTAIECAEKVKVMIIRKNTALVVIFIRFTFTNIIFDFKGYIR